MHTPAWGGHGDGIFDGSITLGDAPLYKGRPLGTGTAVSSRSQEAEMAADIFTAVGHWKANENSS